MLSIRFTRVYGCVGVGHPSSSVVIGIEEDRVKDNSVLDHISGPPRGVEVRGEEGGDVSGYYGGTEGSSTSVGVEGDF